MRLTRKRVEGLMSSIPELTSCTYSHHVRHKDTLYVHVVPPVVQAYGGLLKEVHWTLQGNQWVYKGVI